MVMALVNHSIISVYSPLIYPQCSWPSFSIDCSMWFLYILQSVFVTLNDRNQGHKRSAFSMVNDFKLPPPVPPVNPDSALFGVTNGASTSSDLSSNKKKSSDSQCVFSIDLSIMQFIICSMWFLFIFNLFLWHWNDWMAGVQPQVTNHTKWWYQCITPSCTLVAAWWNAWNECNNIRISNSNRVKQGVYSPLF